MDFVVGYSVRRDLSASLPGGEGKSAPAMSRKGNAGSAAFLYAVNATRSDAMISSGDGGGDDGDAGARDDDGDGDIGQAGYFHSPRRPVLIHRPLAAMPQHSESVQEG